MLIVLLLLISRSCLGSGAVFPTFSSLKSVVQCRIDFASNYVMSQKAIDVINNRFARLRAVARMSLMLYGLR